jgi:hypothetical protein
LPFKTDFDGLHSRRLSARTAKPYTAKLANALAVSHTRVLRHGGRLPKKGGRGKAQESLDLIEAMRTV